MGFGNNNGRGRSGGRGSGRGGRGLGRSNGRGNGSRNNNNGSNNKDDKMKFTPYQEGRVSRVTYTSVKEHIINSIRKTYKNGADIANYLDTRDKEQYGTKPVRAVAALEDASGRARRNIDVQVEQEGLNIDYK